MSEGVNTRMYIEMAPQVKRSSSGGSIFSAPASPGRVNGQDSGSGSVESRIARIQALRGQTSGNAQVLTSGVGDANAQKGGLEADKNQIGATVEYLTNAQATISGLIPQSEKFIADCEKALKEAIAKCDMQGEAEHRKMLAEKKQAHTELLARQAQVEAAKSTEQDKLGSAESELASANATIPRLQVDEQKTYTQTGEFDAKLSEIASLASSKGARNNASSGSAEQPSNSSNTFLLTRGAETGRVSALGNSSSSQSGQFGQRNSHT